MGMMILRRKRDGKRRSRKSGIYCEGRKRERERQRGRKREYELEMGRTNRTWIKGANEREDHKRDIWQEDGDIEGEIKRE